jgi:hypothetical protein
VATFSASIDDNRGCGSSASTRPEGPTRCAAISANVDDDHPGIEQAQRKLRFLRFVPSREADLPRDRVLQIACERRTAEILRQARHKWTLCKPRQRIGELVAAERQRANRRRR